MSIHRSSRPWTNQVGFSGADQVVYDVLRSETHPDRDRATDKRQCCNRNTQHAQDCDEQHHQDAIEEDTLNRLRNVRIDPGFEKLTAQQALKVPGEQQAQEDNENGQYDLPYGNLRAGCKGK